MITDQIIGTQTDTCSAGQYTCNWTAATIHVSLVSVIHMGNPYTCIGTQTNTCSAGQYTCNWTAATIHVSLISVIHMDNLYTCIMYARVKQLACVMMVYEMRRKVRNVVHNFQLSAGTAALIFPRNILITDMTDQMEIKLRMI